MGNLTTQQRVNILWAKGYNPVHLFGNVYFVRYKTIYASKIPLYLIKFIR